MSVVFILTLVHPLITERIFLQTGNKISITLKLIGSEGALANARASYRERERERERERGGREEGREREVKIIILHIVNSHYERILLLKWGRDFWKNKQITCKIKVRQHVNQ